MKFYCNITRSLFVLHQVKSNQITLVSKHIHCSTTVRVFDVTVYMMAKLLCLQSYSIRTRVYKTVPKNPFIQACSD